jgi:DNA-binding response OmpR family regulator
VGQLQIDTLQHRVLLSGRIIRLSAREFKLLEYLARRANEVVPLQELVQITHKLEADHKEASVLLRPLVRSLRRKLGYPAGELGCIESVRGIGYQLIPPNHV